MNQRKYFHKIQERFEMINNNYCKPWSVPFEQKRKFGSKAPCNPRKNCEAVGSLVKYAICTRPTICRVITKL